MRTVALFAAPSVTTAVAVALRAALFCSTRASFAALSFSFSFLLWPAPSENEPLASVCILFYPPLPAETFLAVLRVSLPAHGGEASAAGQRSPTLTTPLPASFS